MNKSKFKAKLESFASYHDKAFNISIELRISLKNKGLTKFSITFDTGDGILLLDDDGDQWLMSEALIDVIYNSKTSEELYKNLKQFNISGI